MASPNRNLGGRPPLYYDILKRFIPIALQHLGKARPVDLKKYYERETGRRIGETTIRRYLAIFLEDGILTTETEISNHEKVRQGLKRRDWNMVWYKLA